MTDATTPNTAAPPEQNPTSYKADQNPSKQTNQAKPSNDGNEEPENAQEAATENQNAKSA